MSKFYTLFVLIKKILDIEISNREIRKDNFERLDFPLFV